ncbi:MAG TPA: hypothetical protein PKN80_09270 [bacterium]|uniref:Periplasmic repressor CpxP n=1 Tax=candidate division TA06 bacterium ADurb.Bin417 TaxID=1852828 RepID=A0A1V5MJW9_UNCT6|nr:MAG: hypothetical protein BWY73_00438 [candidate division TA06 bacterium ADurb.Bin417]HNQ36236.1 hypothetical protein [bacterium]HNS48467.1 hypothetical protein [bacterium]
MKLRGRVLVLAGLGLLLTAGLLLAENPAGADGGKAPGTEKPRPGIEKRVQGGDGGQWGALAQLGLSEEQKASIKSILDTQRERMNSVRQDSTLSREETKKKLAEIEKTGQEQVAALLTTEQKAKLAAWKEKQRADQERKMAERLADRLQLDTEQRVKILPLLKERQAKVQAVQNDQTISNEARKEKLREIHQTYQGKIVQYLSEEQKAKFTERPNGDRPKPLAQPPLPPAPPQPDAKPTA